MPSPDSGLRVVDGLNVVPMDGLWDAVAQVPTEEKLGVALAYAGVEFHDEARRFVAGHTTSLIGIGGIPVAHEGDSDDDIRQHVTKSVLGTREMMGSSAAMSYLNVGNKPIPELYKKVTGMGHLSIAHTVQVNMLVAGISAGTEAEINLQRDVVHFSKVTTARTSIQNQPPLVVRNPRHLPIASRIYQMTSSLAADMRELDHPVNDNDKEIINGFFPFNKATILLISGSLRNFGKLADLRDDAGKEMELREVADDIHGQLGLLWPEIMKDKE